MCTQQLISEWSSYSTVMTEVADRWFTCGVSIGIIEWVDILDFAERTFQNERLLYGVLGYMGRYGRFGIVFLRHAPLVRATNYGVRSRDVGCVRFRSDVEKVQ